MTEDPDDQLCRILTRTKTIAVVGVSPKPDRPSYQVAHYLWQVGYTIIPVNPGQAGTRLFGAEVKTALSEITEPVDMVDIFRRSEAVPPIVEAALMQFPTLQTIWMQLGVVHTAAATQAKARGVEVVMNRCPKIEYKRLFGRV